MSDVADLTALAELSHVLEQTALTLADDHTQPRLIAHEVMSAACGSREAVAMALSYLLRRRTLGSYANGEALADAIDATALALRRTR